MASLFSYVVRFDCGFAPNPDGGWLTLACCKPVIRRSAQVGDWLLGTHGTNAGLSAAVCFVAQVSEAMSFGDYHADPRFVAKRPNARNRGDNIYARTETGGLVQLRNRFHGAREVPHDTRVDRVLVCKTFSYFGKTAAPPLRQLGGLQKSGPGHRRLNLMELGPPVREWLDGLPRGVLGPPAISGPELQHPCAADLGDGESELGGCGSPP